MKTIHFCCEKQAIEYLQSKYPSSFVDTGVEKGCYDIAIAFDNFGEENQKELERVRFN